jgi:hypothetical protein
MWIPKHGGIAAIVFLIATLFLCPVSISYAECNLPRELAGLRLGDSREAVLTKCNQLRETKLSDGTEEFFPQWPSSWNYRGLENRDIPGTQLQRLSGRCALIEGAACRIELLFAKNKLFQIRCAITDTSIGRGILKKIEEKCPGDSRNNIPMYLYYDHKTCWEILVDYLLPGSSLRRAETIIFIDDVPTVEELLAAANKADEL